MAGTIDDFWADLDNANTIDEFMAIEVPCIPPNQATDCSAPLVAEVTGMVDYTQNFITFTKEFVSSPLSKDTLMAWGQL